MSSSVSPYLSHSRSDESLWDVPLERFHRVTHRDESLMKPPRFEEEGNGDFFFGQLHLGCVLQLSGEVSERSCDVEGGQNGQNDRRATHHPDDDGCASVCVSV